MQKNNCICRELSSHEKRIIQKLIRDRKSLVNAVQKFNSELRL